MGCSGDGRLTTPKLRHHRPWLLLQLLFLHSAGAWKTTDDASAWLVYTTDKAQQTNSRFWEAPWEGWNPGPAVTVFD